jgi:hypothetical protein
MSTSPARTPRRERQPEDSTLQLPFKFSVIESIPSRTGHRTTATMTPPSTAFELELATEGRRTDRAYTDRDESAATVLLEAQLHDQLRTARRDAAGSPGKVCPHCMSETTRLYAGRVCPRCLDAADPVSADVAQRHAHHSTQMAEHAVPLLPSREPRSVYSPASRRSEIEVAAREAEAREAEKRLQAVLRRVSEFEVVPAVGATRPLSPRRDLQGERLRLGFESRRSSRLDQLLHEFPDDSPTRANYRTPHTPRSPDSRLGELTVEARARTLSFSPLPD